MKYKFTLNLDEKIIDEIIKDYQTLEISQLMIKYNLKRHEIVKLTNGNGIKKRKDYWTDEELKLAEQGIIPNGRSKKSMQNVRTKKELGIIKNNKRLWTEDEITTLKANWENMSDPELSKLLNRSKESIKSQRIRLNLYNDRTWSDVEKDILLGCHNIEECIERLPNRTEYSIKHMIIRMGIKFDSSRFSQPHQKVCKYLRKLGLVYTIEKKIGNFYIDCFIPSLNLCIEVNGSYWHSSNETKEKDIRKKEFLIKEGYKVLIINENEVNDENYVLKKIIKNTVNCWELLTCNDEDNQQPS